MFNNHMVKRRWPKYFIFRVDNVICKGNQIKSIMHENSRIVNDEELEEGFII